jgi:periplasmic copper chaperone A
MQRTLILWLIALSTLPAAVAALTAPGIQVLQPSAFATAPGAPTAVVLLTLHNIGASADTLLGAKTPLAGKVEFHSSRMSGGVMSMRPLAKVPVPVGSLVEFHSGGNHLMLVGLVRPLTAGMVIPLTLKFQKGGELKVDVPVLPMTAR